MNLLIKMIKTRITIFITFLNIFVEILREPYYTY